MSKFRGALMAKKPEQSEWANVKLRRDLHTKIKVIAALTGEEMSEILDRLARQPVEKAYAATQKEAGLGGKDED